LKTGFKNRKKTFIFLVVSKPVLKTVYFVCGFETGFTETIYFFGGFKTGFENRLFLNGSDIVLFIF
jgi:hypothetical protein